MAKAKRPSRASTKPAPAYASYMIKKLDRQLWSQFVTRAKGDGRSLAWLFRDFIEKYANGN